MTNIAHKLVYIGWTKMDRRENFMEVYLLIDGEAFTLCYGIFEGRVLEPLLLLHGFWDEESEPDNKTCPLCEQTMNSQECSLDEDTFTRISDNLLDMFAKSSYMVRLDDF